MTKFLSLLFLWLPFTIAANSTYTPCTTLCITQASESELEATELRLYTGSDVTEYVTATFDNVSELYSKIDHSKETVLYISGWEGYLTLALGVTDKVLNAYLSQGRYNVMFYDWLDISSGLYTRAVGSTNGLANILATMFNALQSLGWDPNGLHLVGHSLGAQVCGRVGLYADFEVPRITGLDPAGPLYDTVEQPTVSAGDAKVVTLAHMNAAFLGINIQSGDSDIYFNDGTNQPGCEFELGVICSHLRAPCYWADIVMNSSCMIGVQCDSWSNFKDGSCSSNEKTEINDYTLNNMTGVYYLQTNREESYCRGEQGTTYDSSITSTLLDVETGVASTVESVLNNLF